MATPSFKSGIRRSSLAPGDAASSTRAGSHRRSRSLSGFSPPDDATPRSRFVNKTRGSGFPEVSLDDLADEFFGSKVEESEEERKGEVRSGRFRMETESSRRRGRSVSKNSEGARGERRSVSVVRGKRGGGFEDEKNLYSGEVIHRERLPREGKSHYRNDHSSRPQRSASVVARHRCNDLEDEKILYNGEVIHRERLAREGKSQNGNDRSSRARRSASVVTRYRCSDLEIDSDRSSESSKLSFENGNLHKSSARRQVNSAHALRKLPSQKDLQQHLANYSSHSSSLTDDDIRDVHSNKSGSEKTIRAVYSLEKDEHPIGDGDGMGLYEVMCNEVRHAVQEIRTEFEKVLVKKDPTVLANGEGSLPRGSVNAIAEIRRSYTNELEQSEKRKQDLLAELAAEEQRGEELTNIVRELLPAPKQAAVAERPSRSRRRSNDRTRMSRRLTEEAERYFEGFLSNVEDTDISSFDGERSDTSSTLGGTLKSREPPIVHNAISEVHEILANSTSFHDETDGVLLPWLDWETNNDVSPSPCKSKARVPWTGAQESNGACHNTTHPTSSLGSWSPADNGSSSPALGSKFKQVADSSCSSAPVASVKNGPSSFNMDEYLQLQHGEHLLFEMLKQRHRIQSGSLILCGRAP